MRAGAAPFGSCSSCPSERNVAGAGHGAGRFPKADRVRSTVASLNLVASHRLALRYIPSPTPFGIEKRPSRPVLEF
ncbi:hypothetical protein GQ53DRAFT_237763 [Thozetella sp. PMI_491]|nr:hypothetical protein GQ53DRAFT_237763 [Thozetella sp. PMI_491]